MFKKLFRIKYNNNDNNNCKIYFTFKDIVMHSLEAQL